MPNYYSPGVYIEEVNKGPRPIEAVATSVAAFVGFAPYTVARNRNRPVLITSWTQYVDTFGRRDPATGRKEAYLCVDRNGEKQHAYLSHAIFGFFQNGGSRCYVVSVTPDFTPAQPEPARIPDADSSRKRTEPMTVLEIAPHKDIRLDDEIEITIERAPSSPEDVEKKISRVTFRVRQGDQSEEWRGVNLNEPKFQGQSSGGAQAVPRPKKDKADAEGSGAQGDPTTGTPGDAPAQQPGGSTAQVGGTGTTEPVKGTLAYLNAKSKLIQVDVKRPETQPAFGTYYLEVPQPDTKALTQIGETALMGDAAERSGVAGLEIADDVTIVCCPDLMSPLIYQKGDPDSELRVRAVQTAMIAHCELAGGRVAVLDAPPTLNPQEIERWRMHTARYDSMFAALYYPWIKVSNPLGDQEGQPKVLTVPPCGHIAGIYARNDSTRGVHKAPANEIVRGALDPAREISRGEQDGLNPNGINCIRAFPGRGIRVWGARTLTSDPAWRYINVRRLFNMVEKSIERDTQWVVFEPNDPGLWSRVRRDVSAFLMTQWRDGALFGTTPQEAFYVKCDAELNPPESRDLGRLIIEVGMAPVKPAEFVIFRFSQYAAGA